MVFARALRITGEYLRKLNGEMRVCLEKQGFFMLKALKALGTYLDLKQNLCLNK
jgi:hypothetical protein